MYQDTFFIHKVINDLIYIKLQISPILNEIMLQNIQCIKQQINNMQPSALRSAANVLWLYSIIKCILTLSCEFVCMYAPAHAHTHTTN